MSGVRLELLGVFALRNGGGPCTLSTKKTKALLAWLALAPDRAHRRQELAALFWGERPEHAARHSLSQALFSLRKTLSPAGVSPFTADHHQVTLMPGLIVSDVARFEALLADGAAGALCEAAALYRGEFLAGFDGIGEVFDQWLTVRRSRLADGHWNCLSRLLERDAEAGRLEPAIKRARRLLELDPLDEAMHRRLMRLYLAQGRKAAAMRQYAVCAGVLARELDVEPEAKTAALYRSIRRSDAVAEKPRPAPLLDGSRPRMVVPQGVTSKAKP